MARTKFLMVTVVVALGLLWVGFAMAAASFGELEFVGFPSETAVTGEEAQLEGWLKFNEKENSSATNIRLWVSGHEGRVEPGFIAGPLYNGDMITITVYLEGIPGVAALRADDLRGPYGMWTIQLTEATPTSTPTNTSTPTPTSTPTSTPTPTATPTSTPTPTDTPTPTPTDTPTSTPTDTPTSTPTYTPTPTPTYTPTPTPTYTPTPTPTATPTNTPTPTPTPTPMPVEKCYCCSSGDSIYRIDGSSFYGYETKSASDSPLVHVVSPPAPWGWNQLFFEPDSSWQLASEVWWAEFWGSPNWETLPGDGECRPIGLWDENGSQEARSGITHLYRREFMLSPPLLHLDMQVTQVVLEMWSDNKTEWWWGGDSVSYDKEGYIGQIDLFPGYVERYGGIYVLAIQNSNDRVSRDNNPQGTACRLCVTWALRDEPSYHVVYLPLILKKQP